MHDIFFFFFLPFYQKKCLYKQISFYVAVEVCAQVREAIKA
jgi:hypothetical protein